MFDDDDVTHVRGGGHGQDENVMQAETLRRQQHQRVRLVQPPTPPAGPNQGEETVSGAHWLVGDQPPCEQHHFSYETIPSS